MTKLSDVVVAEMVALVVRLLEKEKEIRLRSAEMPPAELERLHAEMDEISDKIQDTWDNMSPLARVLTVQAVIVDVVFKKNEPT